MSQYVYQTATFGPWGELPTLTFTLAHYISQYLSGRGGGLTKRVRPRSWTNSSPADSGRGPLCAPNCDDTAAMIVVTMVVAVVIFQWQWYW